MRFGFWKLFAVRSALYAYPLFATIVLVLPLLAPLPSIGADTTLPQILASCKSRVEIPCIESIQVRTIENKLLIADLTGRLASKEPEFEGSGYEEYSVPGLNFEGTSKNLLIPRIVYYPFNRVNSRDFIAVAVQPSWLNRNLDPTENQLTLPHRPSNELCGTSAKREKCDRSNNFNADLDFLISLRIPSDFSPVWMSGSSKNVKLDWEATKNPPAAWRTLRVTVGTLAREMVLFSDYYSNPIEAIESSPFADYPADWPNLWVHSSRDPSVNVLEKCREIPFLSVMTNAIYQELPKWNAQTETVDLKLYASHLKTNGELNRGFYEMKISEQLAKCFWGIDVSSQTQAQISISYPDAGKEVVVETIKTSFQSGIFEILATNFTFSSPTVKARVLQSPQTSETSTVTVIANRRPSPTPRPSVVGSSKKSIICSKGTQVKKISAKNPKCPKGFKKVV